MKTRPGEIERGSMAIIDAELAARGLVLPAENAAVISYSGKTVAGDDYGPTAAKPTKAGSLTVGFSSMSPTAPHAITPNRKKELR